MDDILERLRQYHPLTCSACDNWAKCGYGEPCDCACHIHPCRDAADEIARLRAENAAMRRQAIQNMIHISEQAGMYQQP